MTSLTTLAPTALRLDEFVARLAAHPSVTGVLFLGSTGTDALTPWSDYDILVVFEELPAPFRLVATWVDGRLTEVYCTTSGALRRIAAATEWDVASEEGIVVAWLRSSRIAYDPAGVLRAAQSAAEVAVRLDGPTDEAAYVAWRKVGYNVAQTRRYLAAGDATSALVVDMRLLYGMADVMVSYFTARKLPWRGEKAAIAAWAEGDADFLERFRAYLSEGDRRRKVERYEDLARLAVAPVGALWATGATTVDLGWGFATGDAPVGGVHLDDALAFWTSLF